MIKVPDSRDFFNLTILEKGCESNLDLDMFTWSLLIFFTEEFTQRSLVDSKCKGNLETEAIGKFYFVSDLTPYLAFIFYLIECSFLPLEARDQNQKSWFFHMYINSVCQSDLRLFEAVIDFLE